MRLERASVALGLHDGAPVAAASAPVGLVVGLAAVHVGIGRAQAVLMSYVVYSGTSQLAAYQLLRVGAPLLVVLATTAIINLRYAIYGASLAPFLKGVPRCWCWLLAFFMVDQGFAVAVHRLRSESPPADTRGYLLTSWLLIWLAWTSSAVAGAVLGVAVPKSWHLEFALPLVLIAVLANALRGRPAWLAGAAGGAVAIVAAGLPLGLGLVAGTVAGVGLGAAADGRRSRGWDGRPKP